MRSLIANGSLPEAEQNLRAQIAAQPGSADAHYLLGYVLFREAKAKESLAEYTEAARYRKPDAYDLRVVGADYVVLGDYSDADKWFTQSLAWAPGDALTWYYLGRTKYNENRFEEAVRAFEKTLQLDPRNIKAEDNLGLSLQALQRPDEAQEAYKRAIEWQANDPHKNFAPFLDMGALLLEQDQAREATPYLEESVRIAPESVKAHQQLGKAYFAQQDFTKAQRELEKALELSPNDAPSHYVLGQIYRKQGLSARAKEQFEVFAKLNGSHSTQETPELPPSPQK